jgi:hypothetical protein
VGWRVREMGASVFTTLRRDKLSGQEKKKASVFAEISMKNIATPGQEKKKGIILNYECVMKNDL